MKPFPVILTDATGVIIKQNAPAQTALGPCIGKRCSDVVGVRVDGKTRCTRSCSSALLSIPGQSQEILGRVRAIPRRVVCTVMDEQRVVMLLPAPEPMPSGHRLTPRETEVLSLVSTGLTTKSVAKQLGIRFATVRTHIEHARSKLGARTRAHAVARALSLGLLDPVSGPSKTRM